MDHGRGRDCALMRITVAAGVTAMRAVVLFGAYTSVALLAGSASPVLAQSPESDTRQTLITTAAAEKAMDVSAAATEAVK